MEVSIKEMREFAGEKISRRMFNLVKLSKDRTKPEYRQKMVKYEDGWLRLLNYYDLDELIDFFSRPGLSVPEKSLKARKKFKILLEEYKNEKENLQSK